MRMIERWFPCAEVSDASGGGWGSGKSEKALFTWFAARPLAQAKAAVITSLLPWPEDNPAEQQRLQKLVIDALTDRDACHDDLVAEIAKHYPDGASLLDPFSGRAMIPLEAARLGVKAWGIDYSPVATLAGQLLADYPLRNWSHEPPLPFTEDVAAPSPKTLMPLHDVPSTAGRLVHDVRRFLDEVGRRYDDAMALFYPKHNGKQPWGYLWAVTLPCQNCGRRFPLTGSLVLRHPLSRKNDPGQSYRIVVDQALGTFEAEVYPGKPTDSPTLVTMNKGGKAVRGKVAVCPFCEHVHAKDVHTRLAAERLGEDTLLIASDLDDTVGKIFRKPTQAEHDAVAAATTALAQEPPFALNMPAVPDEIIPPGNNDTVRPSMYGARTYGELCCTRQTLGFVRLSRIIYNLSVELASSSISQDYIAALCGYAGSVLVRKLKRSTRGTSLQPMLYPTSNRVAANHIFTNEASISFSFDFFETALGDGPGTWPSIGEDTLAVLRNQAARPKGTPARIRQGSALVLPQRDHTFSAVVTDPPYDDMIDYSDASDLFFVYLKRALINTHLDFAVTANPCGVQDKSEEIIIKRGRLSSDHRTREFYEAAIAQAFAEANRVVHPDGIVTIVFGHGDTEAWHRLQKAVHAAGLILTGSWPAKTEAGGRVGSANIVTTLTITCRPAPLNRPIGRASDVMVEVQREVRARVPFWERTGLALTDQLMASAGPAMEVVGRYSEVLDRKGDAVDTIKFLIEARRMVAEAADIQVEGLPLETFDARTRFALFWSRLYGRAIQAKSEARWQALAADLALEDLRGLLVDEEKGTRLAYGSECQLSITTNSSIIDVAFALTSVWSEGLAAAGDVLAWSGRDGEDAHLWAALTYLSARLPEADRDRAAWTGVVRARRSLSIAVRDTFASRQRMEAKDKHSLLQGSLNFDERGDGNGETN